MLFPTSPVSHRLLFLKLVFSWAVLGGCTPNREDAVYVLPDAFRGNAAILFDQPDGTPLEYSDKHRVYRIPQSGVLKTKFKPNYGGYAALRFCYASRFKGVDLTPETAYLPYVNVLNSSTTELADTTVVCFNYGGSAQGQVRVDVFSVSRVRQADSVFALRQAVTDKVLLPFSPLDSLGNLVDSL